MANGIGAFTRVLNPGTVRGRMYNSEGDIPVYVKVQYDGRRLSITGVEGPRRNGDAWGGCGQIGVGAVTPGEGWDAAMVARLGQVWNRWHLNDMRAGCEHQQGWRICPGHYHAKGPWDHDVLKGKAVIPEGWRAVVDDDGIMIHARLFVTITNCAGQPEEHKGESWQTSTRCTLDMLSKPCPTCGYKYGSAWLFESVPLDVLDWLRALPETTTTPAWV